MRMKLVDQIRAMYRQAQRDLDRIIEKRPDTAQARYDRKKALKKGHEPKRYTAGSEKIKHEMYIEHRWILKGVQEVVDYLLEHEYVDKEWIQEVIGDVESALNEGTEEDA